VIGKTRKPPVDATPRIVSAPTGTAGARGLRLPVRVRRQTGLEEIREGKRPFALAHRDTLFRRGLAVADIVAAGVALNLAILIGGDTPTYAVVASMPLVVLLSKVAGLYDRDEHLLRKTTLDEAPALLQVATTWTLVVWLLEGVFVQGILGREQVLGLWVLLLGSMILSRAIVRRIVVAVSEPERCLVLGSAQDCEDLERTFDRGHSINAVMVGRVPLGEEPPANGNGGNGNGGHGAAKPLGAFGELTDLLISERVDRVIIAAPGSPTEQLLDKIRLVKSLGIKVSVLPRLFDVVGSSVEVDDLGGMTLLGLRRYELTTSSQILKRGLDVSASVAVILLLAPLLAAIALAIKLTSPGPVLFRQRRIGRNGVPFPMLKFRSMYEGADEQKGHLRDRNEAEGLFKISDDPRVTPVGRFLRSCSLDELPQLINVLKGEMSLVGPRPLVGDEDALITGWLRRRLDVIPGMTGVWQVHGSARVPLTDMVKMDYIYRANWSLWLDVKILLRTVPLVLTRRGM
jgi:exopolysaccharide biosynthesis polyprenyl glycosylphosphotransferase